MITKQSNKIARAKRHARIRHKISGTPECPRLSVFRSNAEIYCQVIDDVAAVTLASASSKAMKLTNGGNIEGAKLVGAEIARVCLAKGIEKKEDFDYIKTTHVDYVQGFYLGRPE